MTTRLSNQKIQYNTLLLFFSFVIIYFMLAVLKTSVSCIDSQGCLLKHCKDVYFLEVYRNKINDARAVNPAACMYSARSN